MFLQNSGELTSEMDDEETELSRIFQLLNSIQFKLINAEESNFDNGMRGLRRGKVHIQL